MTFVMSQDAVKHDSEALVRPGDVVFLVHGTFARSATWTNENGMLTTSIKQAVPDVSIYPFQWSGSNSYSARTSAAKELAARIRSAARHPGVGVHLIGHSHGGNVALYALEDRETRSAVRSVAFLGTPFLNYERRAYEFIAYFYAYLAAFLIFFLGYLIAGAIISFWTIDFSAAGANDGTTILLSLIFNPAMFAVAAFFAFTFFKGRRKVLTGHINGLLLRQLDQVAAKLAKIDARPTQPIFIATVGRDEARVWLRIIDALSAVPIFLSRISLVAAFAVTIGAVVAVLLSKLEYLPRFDEWWENAILFFMFGAIILTVCAQIAAIFMSVGLRGHRFGFGWEGLLGHQAVAISVSELPGWDLPSRSKHAIFTPDDVPGLRHSSFHASKPVAEELVRWLTHPSGRGAGNAL